MGLCICYISWKWLNVIVYVSYYPQLFSILTRITLFGLTLSSCDRIDWPLIYFLFNGQLWSSHICKVSMEWLSRWRMLDAISTGWFHLLIIILLAQNCICMLQFLPFSIHNTGSLIFVFFCFTSFLKTEILKTAYSFETRKKKNHSYRIVFFLLMKYF